MAIEQGETAPLERDESAAPLTIDSPELLNFYDPDEDEETPGNEGSTKGKSENPDQSDETPDEYADENDEAPDGPEVPADDKMVVALPDGTKKTVAELRADHLRQADYTRNMVNLANRNEEARKFSAQTKSNATRIDAISQRFEAYLDSLVPGEPDSNLIATNPQAYLQQMESRKTVGQLIETLRAFKEEAAQTKGEIDNSELEYAKADERHRLAQVLPFTANPQKFEKFMADVKKTALDFQITEQEFSQIYNHRLYNILYWAKRGKDGEARAKEARSKLAQTPVVKGPKRGAAPSRPGNADAARRARATGRIEDIMRMDFE